jgi:hypothetical protein
MFKICGAQVLDACQECMRPGPPTGVAWVAFTGLVALRQVAADVDRRARQLGADCRAVVADLRDATVTDWDVGGRLPACMPPVALLLGSSLAGRRAEALALVHALANAGATWRLFRADQAAAAAEWATDEALIAARARARGQAAPNWRQA